MMGSSKKSKPENMGEAWMNILQYIKRYRYVFVIAVILSAIGSMLSLVGPYYLSDMTDAIEDGIHGNMDLDLIWGLAVTLLTIYAFSGIVQFVDNYLMATVSQRSAQMFRRDVSRKMDRIPVSYFDRSSKGDVMSRVTNDIDTLGTSMNQCIGSIVTALTTLFGSFIMMTFMNIHLTLLCICIAIVGFVVIKVVAKHTQRYFRSQQKNLGAMNGLVEEQYSGHMIVSSFGGQEDALKRFETINDELSVTSFRSQFLGSISTHLNGLISNVGYVLVCVTGAMMYIRGDISFGIIVAFMIYVKLFTGSFTQISSAVVSMQSVAAAAERVFVFLDYDEMSVRESTVEPATVTGRVEFKDVRFGYDEGKEIIHGFSAVVEPGQKVAIVGPTGAGKTTMMNLLMRFYDVNSGDITIDGISINDIDRSDIRSMFGMVLQDTWMFEGTLRENLVFNREGITDGDLDKVCYEVGLHHYITSLPDRYDTMMDDEDSLSVGQKQQITIARALIGKPSMIILDEATSSVDTLTEMEVQKAMDRMMEGRTSFVIAHRLSTILDADMILVMDHGDIVETGTHTELMERNGFYRNLFNSQFETTSEN